MELRHLRYFSVIADTLSFTRAAAQLHVTQPTLSHQIRQLETELGVSLFERRGRSIKITEAGENLRRHVLPALAHIDAAVQALHSPGPAATGIVRLGATPSFIPKLVPACAAKFLGLDPGHRLEVQEQHSDELQKRISDGTLDLGVSYQPSACEDLWFEPLYTENLRLIVGCRHPLARKKRVRMVELHRQRLVMLTPMTTTRQILDKYFAMAGAQPTIVAEFSSVTPAIELVRTTSLASIIGEYSIPSDDGICVVPLHDPAPTRSPGLLWPRMAKHSHSLELFAAILRQEARHQGPREAQSRARRA